MSTVITNNVQLGQDPVVTNNFTIQNPDDGTIKVSIGNSGLTTLDSIIIKNTGDVEFKTNVIIDGGFSSQSNISAPNFFGSFNGNINGALGTFSSDVIVGGNLTIMGNSTIIDTQTITAVDNNITLGNVALPSNVSAVGGGITVLGTTNKTFEWLSAPAGWTSSDNITAPNFIGNLTGYASKVITNANLTGDVTSIGNATTLATVNPNTGTFGSVSAVPVVTVNGKGLITGVSTATISQNISVTGGDLTMSGTTLAAITNATLNTVNTNVGTYGDQYHVPVLTVNGKGLVTGVSTAAISGNIAVTGGDLTLSGVTGTNITNATLATVNPNVGVFGDTLKIPQYTVNAKGLITSSSNVTIGVVPNATTASVAMNSNVVTTSTNATYYPTIVSASSGNLIESTSTGLTFNPSTNTLTTTSGVFNNVNISNGGTIKGTIIGNIAGAITSLTVSSNAIAVDMSLNNNFAVTLQAATTQTLSTPTNATAGSSGQIAITQNATPSVLNFSSSWISANSSTTVNPIAGSVTLLTYYVVDSTHIWYGLGSGVMPGIPYPGAGIANSTGTAWGTSYSTSGSGSVALTTSPTFVTPVLGTPASGDFSTGTFTWPTFNQSTTGSANNTSYLGGKIASSYALLTQANVASFNTRTGAVTLTSGDVTTALTYTPYNATNPSGYVTATQANVASFNTRTGAVTLTSGDVTTALTYTPYNATNPNGYVTATQANVASFNTRTGAVTLTSGDVTTALTYTPYNATNPSGYITSSGTASAVTNSVTFNNSGSGAASGITYNGSAAQTISYNTIGAQAAGTYVTPTTLSNATLAANVTSLYSTGNITADSAHFFIGNGSLLTGISGGVGSMVYPGAGIANSTGTAWGTSYGTTGSGSVVLSTSPTLTTPALGTPSSGVLTNCTGTATGLTAGYSTYSSYIQTSSSSTNYEIPVMGAGITGGYVSLLGRTTVTLNPGLSTLTASKFIGSVTSLQSATAGVDVSAAAAPTSGQVLTATSSTTATWQAPGAGSMVYPGAGIANSTGTAWGTSYGTSGSGNVALTTSPTFVTPVLGTPASGTLTNCTFPTLNQNTTGSANSASYLGSVAAAGYSTLAGNNTWTGIQTFNGTSSTIAEKVTNGAELVNIVSAAPSATQSIYINSGAVTYFTTSAANNWTANVSFSSGTLANVSMAVGDSITIAVLTTQGATAYYASGFQIDGSAVTPKWQGGTAPSAGNASGIDSYSYTIIKTAATPTYTVLASLTQFK